ncbi:MAG: lysylphosphatidylglycerol synthase domain-containing protein [Gemmataceae bacterium]
MRAWLRRWWPVGKAVLAVAILVFVGRQFVLILQSPELWARPLPLRVGWLAATVLFYVIGLTIWGGFWLRLMHRLGQRPAVLGAYRAYYLGHLGKYVPGKAWSLVLRCSLARRAGANVGIAALTATYETLTTMAAGALLAVVLFTLQAREDGSLWKAGGLLALAGIPILPGVFNRLVRKLSAPFREPTAEELPSLKMTTLIGGLGLAGLGWLVVGLSLWSMIQALSAEPAAWSGATWLRYTAYLALAYVAGYLTLPAPGGLGVRELILQGFLAPELGPELAVVVVLVLRLLWILAELFMAAVLYWLPFVVDHWVEPSTSPNAPSL